MEDGKWQQGTKGCAGVFTRRVVMVSAVMALALVAGCSHARTSEGGGKEATQSSMRTQIGSFQDVSEPDSALIETERLIANVSRGSTLDDLEVWALKIVGDVTSTHTVDYYPIDTVPEFLRELDPQHGNPQHGGPAAWVLRQDGEVKVRLAWFSGAGFLWGFEVGKPDYRPPPALPGMEYHKLKPGVFAYSIDASSVKTEVEK